MDEILYYIIRKAHIIDNRVEYTPIGYVLTPEDEAYINEEIKQNTIAQWIIANIVDLKTGAKTAVDAFNETAIEYIYCGEYRTYDITGMNLQQIIDLDNPEGV